MRIACTLLLASALSSCGHLARVNKTQLGYVELYAGVEHQYQLRVPYKVQLYEIFPTHRYTSSVWIGLDGSDSVLQPKESKARTCPEGTSTDSEGYELRGTVTLSGDSARIALEEYRYESGGRDWYAYEFNGMFRLVRSQESPIEVARAQAEAIARDGRFSTVWYCKSRPTGGTK
jgi:hypothetical protein